MLVNFEPNVCCEIGNYKKTSGLALCAAAERVTRRQRPSLTFKIVLYHSSVSICSIFVLGIVRPQTDRRRTKEKKKEEREPSDQAR
jgi:hypothetical protein